LVALELSVGVVGFESGNGELAMIRYAGRDFGDVHKFSACPLEKEFDVIEANSIRISGELHVNAL